MKYCEKCKINVRGNIKNCPLCQNKLSGSSDEILYPKLETVFKQYKIFFKFLILITAIISVTSLAVNLLIPQSGIWSLFVVFGIICFWICLVTAYKRRNNLAKNISSQVFLISILCIIWDIVTGWRGWSLSYVLPISCTAAIFSLVILSRLLKFAPADYIVCLATDILLGIIPLIFFLSGLASTGIPSVICTGLSVIAFIFILLFEGKEIKIELAKRLHI